MDDWCSSCGTQGIPLSECPICHRKFCYECHDVHRSIHTEDECDDYYGSEYDEETRDAMRIDYDETDPW